VSSNFISPATISSSSYVVNNYTFADIAYAAYRMAGGLKMPGQGLSSSEQQEILDVANHLIDGIAIENLMFLFTIRTVVALTAGKYIYGVGPGQDWDIEVPNKINTAGFILQKDQGQTEAELPMGVIVSYEQYAQFIAKKVTASIPLILYYQMTIGANSPYGSATIWPVPQYDSSSNQGAYIALYTPGRVQEFQSFEDVLVLPKGWREFLAYNLAVRVHQRPPYNLQPMDPSVEKMAVLYKARIMDQQLTPILAYPDPAVSPKRTAWYSGLPRAWTPY